MLVLSTPRLWLRPVWPEDARVFAGLISWEVARNTARMPWPYTLEGAEVFIASPAWPEAPLDTARASIVTKDRGELIGCVGFGRNLQSGALEIGYWLGEAVWGRGYASEAAAAWLEAAFALFRLPVVDSGYFSDNPASGRVLAKLGFEPTGQVMPDYPCLARGGTAEAVIMRLPAGRWRARRAVHGRPCS